MPRRRAPIIYELARNELISTHGQVLRRSTFARIFFMSLRTPADGGRMPPPKSASKRPVISQYRARAIDELLPSTLRLSRREMPARHWPAPVGRRARWR